MLVDRILAEAVDVIEEHGLDQFRIHDEHRLEAELVIDDDRLLVEIAAPTRHRIGDHAGEQHEKRQPPGRRFRHLDYGRI